MKKIDDRIILDDAEKDTSTVYLDEEHTDWIVPLLKRPRAKYAILERVPVYPDDHVRTELRALLISCI